MRIFTIALLLYLSIGNAAAKKSPQTGAGMHASHSYYRRQACPDYKDYSALPHPPYSEGPNSVPFQRPAETCRLFKSVKVEEQIEDFVGRMADLDHARLFENCFPNTLDTTVRWHKLAGDASKPVPGELQSFIVTGDINAQWLRDSTNQLAQYQHLAKNDVPLRNLLIGAINTQTKFVLASPYCNAFQPPKESGLSPTYFDFKDTVSPVYDPNVVFECKYEVDSLASFLSLANQFYKNTGNSNFITPEWEQAIDVVLRVIEQQSTGTFTAGGAKRNMVYTFQRQTDLGTETLNLKGIGNPLGSGTGLVRSAFRPSDDATIMQFFVPGNAFLSVELGRTASMLTRINASKYKSKIEVLNAKSRQIREAIYKHAVVQHPTAGEVFAYEVDGYGSQIFMDDANLPSLLALPLMGFVNVNDKVYQNTRKMVLDPKTNPYYILGSQFEGIGGPHVGIRNAWPISLLIECQTTDDDELIKKNLADVLKISSKLGLIHESVDVDKITSYTRSWFAWANSVYAQTILDLAERKPHLVFKPGKFKKSE